MLCCAILNLGKSGVLFLFLEKEEKIELWKRGKMEQERERKRKTINSTIDGNMKIFLYLCSCFFPDETLSSNLYIFSTCFSTNMHRNTVVFI